MEQRAGWLHTHCAQMAVGLLSACEENRLEQHKRGFAQSVLGYYNSPLHFLPDLLPGLGFLDDYLLLSVAMWVCETDTPEVNAALLAKLPLRIRKYMELKETSTLSEEQTPSNPESIETETGSEANTDSEVTSADVPSSKKRMSFEERVARRKEREKIRRDRIVQQQQKRKDSSE